MDYVIKRSNGKIYATIASNTILGPNVPNSNPVPLNLIGKNKVSYGQAINENALWLAENFAGPTAPRGAVPGQIWYNYTSGTGQLLIALEDGAPQPLNSDPTTEAKWASIPMISLQNTVPEAESSLMGRMVLTNSGDTLMVLMKNKEWREIQTSRPKNKQYETLLDINYDIGKKYIAFTQSNSNKPIAFFNDGGGITTDSAGYTVLQDGNGTLRFGSNYFYELKIMARMVNDNNGDVVSVPSAYKTWMVTGSFYIDNEGTFTPGTTTAVQIPDPRKISGLTQIVDTYDQLGTTANWNISVDINGVDSTLPNQNGTTEADYNAFINESLNSTKHLGFKITGAISGLNAGETVLTQWSALLKITGIPPVGV